jgi:catechol 2,3-dioxygenase-like lactoylglutathione lyase family enzyme
MLDHIGLPVADYERAKAFYLEALAPLGVTLLFEETGKEANSGFGENGKAYFWIWHGLQPVRGLHVAFTAKSRSEVDAFYRAALAAGGRDNSAPGLRPHYHASYYGAFVFDAEGNNIEAVCHRA